VISCGRFSVEKKAEKDGILSVFKDKKTGKIIREEYADLKGRKKITRYFHNGRLDSADYYYPGRALEKSEWFYPDGRIRCSFFYDLESNLKSELFYNESNEIIYYHEMNYDEKRQKTGEVIYHDQKPLYQFTYEYSPEGFLNLQKQFDSTSHLQRVYDFTLKEGKVKISYYNEAGKLQEEQILSTIDEDKELIYYNSDNQRTASITAVSDELIYTEYSTDGTIKIQTVMNERGAKKASLTYNRKGQLSSRLEYNDLGKENKNTVYDENGNILYTVEYVYDRRGTITGIRSYGADGKELNQIP
jgi:antitoxin component YwqK of YwqJK toxin-antitoxin module